MEIDEFILLILFVILISVSWTGGYYTGLNDGEQTAEDLFYNASYETQKAYLRGRSATCEGVTDRQIKDAINEGLRLCDLYIPDEDLIIYTRVE